MTKALIFDLDGTLLNTLEDLTDSMNVGLTSLGFPKRSLGECQGFIGNGVELFATRALPEYAKSRENILALTEAMEREYLKRYKAKTYAYEGMTEALLAFQEAGLALTVFSNKIDEMSKLMVREYFPAIDFKVVLGSGKGREKKPHPQGALWIAEELKLSPSEFFFIGDSVVDIETARRAGMLSIAVAWGFRRYSELAQAGPDHLVATPGELQAFILKHTRVSRD